MVFFGNLKSKNIITYFIPNGQETLGLRPVPTRLHNATTLLLKQYLVWDTGYPAVFLSMNSRPTLGIVWCRPTELTVTG